MFEIIRFDIPHPAAGLFSIHILLSQCRNKILCSTANSLSSLTKTKGFLPMKKMSRLVSISNVYFGFSFISSKLSDCSNKTLMACMQLYLSQLSIQDAVTTYTPKFKQWGAQHAHFSSLHVTDMHYDSAFSSEERNILDLMDHKR